MLAEAGAIHDSGLSLSVLQERLQQLSFHGQIVAAIAEKKDPASIPILRGILKENYDDYANTEALRGLGAICDIESVRDVMKTKEHVRKVSLAAISARNRDLVIALLDTGVDINNTENGSFIMAAIASGDTEILQLLLEKGAKLYIQKYGTTALDWANEIRAVHSKNILSSQA